MVLQVLSDARQMMRGCDAMPGQRSTGAYAGQQQQLRRLERAGGDENFAAGANLFDSFALPVFDADGALAFEQNAGGLRLGLDAQIGARPHMRVDIGPRRAPAFAVLLRDLVDAEAFVILGVEILADPELRL